MPLVDLEVMGASIGKDGVGDPLFVVDVRVPDRLTGDLRVPTSINVVKFNSKDPLGY